MIKTIHVVSRVRKFIQIYKFILYLSYHYRVRHKRPLPNSGTQEDHKKTHVGQRTQKTPSLRTTTCGSYKVLSHIQIKLTILIVVGSDAITA